MKFFDFFMQILPRSFLSRTKRNTSGVYAAIARQFDDLEATITTTRDQLFIDSATWALPIYEAEYAIKLVDQSSQRARRNNVMAMSRGGLGATPKAITTVLESYGYSTRIIEDHAAYKVTIEFTDFRGVPSNLGDLQVLLTRFIPAHLVLEWKFIYTLHSELEPYTHEDLEPMTHEELETQLPQGGM